MKLGTIDYRGKQLSVHSEHYSSNKALAVVLHDDVTPIPYAIISENHWDAQLRSGEFVLQERNLTPEFLEALKKSNIFEDTGHEFQFGPFGTVAPIWRIKGEVW